MKEKKRYVNSLGRVNRRRLENWMEANKAEIIEKNLTRRKLAVRVRRELGLEVTRANLEGAAKAIPMKIPSERVPGGRRMRSVASAMVAEMELVKDTLRKLCAGLGVDFPEGLRPAAPPSLFPAEGDEEEDGDHEGV